MIIQHSADNSTSRKVAADGGWNEGSPLHAAGISDDYQNRKLFCAGDMQFTAVCTQAKVDLSSVGNNSATPFSSEFHFAPTLTEAENPPQMRPVFRPKIADSNFFLMNGIHLGMQCFDVEMTQRGIASHHCREANPLRLHRKQVS